MFCPKCGKELTGDTQFCPNCGNKVKKEQKEQTPHESRFVNSSPTATQSQMKHIEEGVCPKCGSHDCEIHVQQSISGSGSNYNAGVGCLGFLLTGPFGLLCGLCGTGSKTSTTHQSVWVCKSCGNQFPTRSTVAGNIAQLGAIIGFVLSIGIPLILIIPIINLSSGSSDYILVPFFFAAITFGLCYILWKGIRSLCEGHPVKEFLTEQEFGEFKKMGLVGFLFCPVIFIIVILLSLILT